MIHINGIDMVAEGEFLFLYNSNKIEDRTAKGYALSINGLAINERDIHRDHLTETQIANISEYLNCKISDLFETKGMASYETFSDEEIVKILAKDPSKLKTPIIISKHKSFIVDSSFEMIKGQLGIPEKG